MMGALYEDVETFFGDIFAWYGRIVARFPWFFVMIPLVSCGLLGMGLCMLRMETRIDVLYTPIGSQAAKDMETLDSRFPDDTSSNYYFHQQIGQAIFGEVIIKLRESNENLSGDCEQFKNVLSPSALEEIWRLHYSITNVTCVSGGGNYSYHNVCATRDGLCLVDGDLHLLEEDSYTIEFGHQLKNKHTSRYRRHLGLDMLFKKLNYNNVCSDAIRLRYNLRHYPPEEHAVAMAWEMEFIKQLQQFTSPNINIAYKVSASMDMEMRKDVLQDTQFLIFSILAMLAMATFVGSGSNCVTNHVILAYMGVFGAFLAILAAFGLLSLVGLRFVKLCAVMPFLVLGIGADDMFQLLTEWRQSNIRDSIEDRMAATLRSTAVSITITSLTDLIAFCIGATSPYFPVRNFCACSGVAILLCYVNQLTFYSGCIVIHARRVEASRHWLTCLKTKSREELEEEGTNAIKVILCGGNPPRRIGEEGGMCRKLSRILYTYYPRFLLHWVTKLLVFSSFVAYFAMSIWGSSNIKQGAKIENFIHEKSYFTKYNQWSMEHFKSNGPVIMFVVLATPTLRYWDTTTQHNLANLLNAAQLVPGAVNGSTISWLEEYIEYQNNLNLSYVPRSNVQFIQAGLHDFLGKSPMYKGDIAFDEDGISIIASRFYVQCSQIGEAEQEGDLMIAMRRAANSVPTLAVTAYSTEFIYYEHYVSIMKNTMLPVGVTIIGLLFVALVFIPHPIAVTCATLAMISIVIGMVGFMHFWGLALSSVTVIQLIMSLGICVSFTVRMSHSFMTATGKNRNERVTVAIEKVGIPILNGAFSTLFCAAMLSFGTSFIFTSFFKTMVLVFFLGVIHALVFLPVLFSLIGPRRTSKPRVFVPVSPGSRSLQDTYRTNSLVPSNISHIQRDRKSRCKASDGKADTWLRAVHSEADASDSTLKPNRSPKPSPNLTRSPWPSPSFPRCSPTQDHAPCPSPSPDRSPRPSPSPKRSPFPGRRPRDININPVFPDITNRHTSPSYITDKPEKNSTNTQADDSVESNRKVSFAIGCSSLPDSSDTNPPTQNDVVVQAENIEQEHNENMKTVETDSDTDLYVKRKPPSNQPNDLNTHQTPSIQQSSPLVPEKMAPKASFDAELEDDLTSHVSN